MMGILRAVIAVFFFVLLVAVLTGPNGLHGGMWDPIGQTADSIMNVFGIRV